MSDRVEQTSFCHAIRLSTLASRSASFFSCDLEGMEGLRVSKIADEEVKVSLLYECRLCLVPSLIRYFAHYTRSQTSLTRRVLLAHAPHLHSSTVELKVS